jgi:hypothetical protein
VRPPARPGLWLVATREVRFFRRDLAGWFLVVAIPLLCFAVLAWTFSSAVVRGLNVVVVDMDRSAISTRIIQEVAAAPGLRVAERGDNLTTATRAIRLGEAFPSESAIDGLVRINQMVAVLGEVRADWLYLWLLAAIYFGLAVMAARRHMAREEAAALAV